ncbi:MAG: hypothetical protein GTN64_02620, partial [Candidatus Latescibacteria bacterium]|nr:hypothetical protein [Candidatus Latescibacterota bacterium]NIO77509.1 hypothetical protein [Candidatus Latescibacterota bacterium]
LRLVGRLAFVMAAIVALSLNITRASQTITDFKGQELVFLTWSEYIDPEVVSEFEKRFNAKVKFAYFEEDDQRTEILV